jgi:hypothetical protein
MKKKIQNKRSSLASIKCVDVVEMNDEGLYVPDDVPEEASAARYEMLPKKSKLTLSERIGKIYE